MHFSTLLIVALASSAHALIPLEIDEAGSTSTGTRVFTRPSGIANPTGRPTFTRIYTGPRFPYGTGRPHPIYHPHPSGHGGKHSGRPYPTGKSSGRPSGKPFTETDRPIPTGPITRTVVPLPVTTGDVFSALPIYDETKVKARQDDANISDTPENLETPENVDQSPPIIASSASSTETSEATGGVGKPTGSQEPRPTGTRTRKPGHAHPTGMFHKHPGGYAHPSGKGKGHAKASGRPVPTGGFPYGFKTKTKTQTQNSFTKSQVIAGLPTAPVDY